MVVAIIAILAAMLMPTLSKARQTAKRTACISNQKQLGLLYQGFSNEYDGKVPFQYYWMKRHNLFYSKSNRRFNFGVIQKAGNLNEVNILVCPSYKGGSSWPNRLLGTGVSPNRDLESTGLESYTHYNARPITQSPGLTDIPVTSRLVKLDDFAEYAIISESSYLMYGSNGDPFHEFQGAVTTYGDGHVLFVRGKNTFIATARSRREDSDYFSDADSDGIPESGIWWYLDNPK